MSISKPNRPLFISGHKDGDPPLRACDIPITAFGKSTGQSKFYPGAPAKNTRRATKRKDDLLGKKGLSAHNMFPPGKKRFRKQPDRFGAGLCAGYQDVRLAVTAGGIFSVPYDNANHFACFDHFRLTQVSIQMTGARGTDAAAANLASPIVNDVTVPHTTWHHVANYSAITGTCTMQLVPTGIHAAVNHRGAVWQWEQVNGGNYGP